MPHTGFHDLAVLPFRAAVRMVSWLYQGQPLPEAPINNLTPRKTDRNALILLRYSRGVTMSALAAEFGISEQRVHQILRS